jgi:hypothetical protein
LFLIEEGTTRAKNEIKKTSTKLAEKSLTTNRDRGIILFVVNELQKDAGVAQG